MGWWSATILGGDVPMDTIYDVASLFGGYTEEWEGWDANLPALSQCLESTSEERLLTYINNAYAPAIAAQCVAYAHMACGAVLPQALREVAVKTCESEEVSGWCESEERKAHLEYFKAMILNYDDKTPQTPPEEGLFEVWAKHMDSGSSGLLNKNSGKRALPPLISKEHE